MIENQEPVKCNEKNNHYDCKRSQTTETSNQSNITLDCTMDGKVTHFTNCNSTTTATEPQNPHNYDCFMHNDPPKTTNAASNSPNKPADQTAHHQSKPNDAGAIASSALALTIAFLLSFQLTV